MRFEIGQERRDDAQAGGRIDHALAFEIARMRPSRGPLDLVVDARAGFVARLIECQPLARCDGLELHKREIGKDALGIGDRFHVSGEEGQRVGFLLLDFPLMRLEWGQRFRSSPDFSEQKRLFGRSLTRSAGRWTRA